MAVNYLFLGQLGNFSIPQEHAIRMETITVMNTGLNFAGTMLIQFTWAYLSLFQDQFFISGNLATVIMAGQVALTGLENTYPDLSFCIAASIALVYLYTCVWAWMFLYGFYHVLDNTIGFPGRASQRRWLYVIFGYVLPAIPIIPVSIFHTEDLISGRLCWIKGPYLWIYMGPVYFIASFNLLMLLFLTGKRWRRDGDKEKKVKMGTRIRNVILTFLAEGQVLGFFWWFGFVPGDGYKYLVFNWIFVAIAGPQNLGIFALFYCTNKTVISLLASHYEDTVAAALEEVKRKKAAKGYSESYSESSE